MKEMMASLNTTKAALKSALLQTLTQWIEHEENIFEAVIPYLPFGLVNQNCRLDLLSWTNRYISNCSINAPVSVLAKSSILCLQVNFL